jgi:hypothetical protein
MYSVHRALSGTVLAAWLGRSLHANMKTRPFNKLVGSLMTVLNKFQPANLEFYLDLIAKPDFRQLDPLLKEKAAVLLIGFLSELPRSRREERWVVPALESLRELDTPLADQLLDEVITSKRLIFFAAWPDECRAAALKSPGEKEEQDG